MVIIYSEVNEEWQLVYFSKSLAIRYLLGHQEYKKEKQF